LGNSLHTLMTGESATAEPMINHLFRNRSGKPCRFTVELRPASRGFEQSLQIAYGLTNDACANRTDSRKTNLPLPGYLISVKVTYPAGGVSLNSSYINKQKKRE